MKGGAGEVIHAGWFPMRLSLEAVPLDNLEEHPVQARSKTNIGRDLLVHEAIVNLGAELMEQSQVQALAGTHDALAHQAHQAGEVFAAPERNRRSCGCCEV